jgi:co-chaperonin GroES (HSP10)
MENILDVLNITNAKAPVRDKLLVLPLQQGSFSRLIVDMTENREYPMFGIVLAVGPGTVGSETGRPIAVEAQPGDLIGFGRYAGLALDVLGPDERPLRLLIMQDQERLVSQPAGTYTLDHLDDLRHVHETGLTCEFCPRADLSEERQRVLEETGRTVDIRSAGAVEETNIDALAEQERQRVLAES